METDLASKAQQLEEITKQYNKLKTLLDQTTCSRSCREHTATTLEMISSTSSSVRYRRRQESKNVLEYIHGGENAAVQGAWDVVKSFAGKDMISTFVANYKRGKLIQNLVAKTLKEHTQSDQSLQQALAFKYQNFLSRESLIYCAKPTPQLLMVTKKFGCLVI